MSFCRETDLRNHAAPWLNVGAGLGGRDALDDALGGNDTCSHPKGSGLSACDEDQKIRKVSDSSARAFSPRNQAVLGTRKNRWFLDTCGLERLLGGCWYLGVLFLNKEAQIAPASCWLGRRCPFTFPATNAQGDMSRKLALAS